MEHLINRATRRVNACRAVCPLNNYGASRQCRRQVAAHHEDQVQ